MSGLTDAEQREAKEVFASFDSDSSGSIDAKELTAALKKLKMYESPAQTKKLIAEVDKDENGTIEYLEFLDIVVACKKGESGGAGFAKVYSGQKELISLSSKDGGKHSFSVDEMSAFSEHLNQLLAEDPDCKHLLPISADGKDLSRKVKDGILLSKFINVAVPDTIDPRALNKPKGGKALSRFQINENQNLCIEAAKSIGVITTNIGAAEMVDGQQHPHLVLGMVWQLVKIQLLNSISLKNHPELIRLLEDGETLEDLLKLTPEQLLLRWFNYHLKNAGHPKRVRNFKGDVKDSEAYTVLLNQIAPQTCDKSALKMTDREKRAQRVLDNATKLNVNAFIKAKDIVAGNGRLNLAFTAAIFNQCPGLDPLEQEELDKAGLMDDDEGDSREERAFRMWMNSLGMDGLYINNLFEDLKDGLALLKVIDKIEPGLVSWKKVEMKPNNKFKKVNNNNYAVVLGKTPELNCSLPGTQGSDVVDGNKKLILGYVWQLMRHHVLKFLDEVKKEQFGGKEVTEPMMVNWCNETVKAAGPIKEGTSVKTMKSFKDKSLTDGLFFLNLLHACRPGILDEEYVIDPATEEKEKTDNARYALSVARKLGATIFLLPEDIVEVKPKMILTFVASIMSVKLRAGKA